MANCDTTKTIAAITAAIAAGAPNITAPTAAIASPRASRIVFITLHPFTHISTNSLIASTAPPITAAIPPMIFTTPPTAAPIPAKLSPALLAFAPTSPKVFAISFNAFASVIFPTIATNERKLANPFPTNDANLKNAIAFAMPKRYPASLFASV